MPPLFHSEAISFVRRTNFIKKTTCRNKSLFLSKDYKKDIFAFSAGDSERSRS